MSVKPSTLFFLLLFITVLPLSIKAQRGDKNTDNQDVQLGMQASQQGDFEKAVYYFERLYSKSSKDLYYTQLLNAYLELNDFKKAEKLIKRQLKRHGKKADYFFDLGYLFRLSNEPSNSKKEFENAIDALSDQEDVIRLANKFIGINEMEFAKETYLKGRKKIKEYPFNFELAQVYDHLQNYEGMIEEYLSLLELNTGYLQSVQNALQTVLNTNDEDEKRNLLRTSLLKRIQRNASATVFSEMLIWLYVQEKDFAGAFNQAKALDKRNKESGNRIMALAGLCRTNKQYKVAIDCYEYIIAKGPENMRYQTAKMALVSVYNDKIVNSAYTSTDLVSLEQLYKTTLLELGENSNTVELLKGLAHLQAFYLGKIDTAISLLENTIRIPQLKSSDLANCKIELADIYLIDNDVWEASLLYSQVEKSFKYDRIGEIAKFKNAKVFYYSGEFQWAKAQLDVLKGSTSKLISNDAMDLSLLITDNTTIDTLTLPLLKFANAELLILQNKTEEALRVYDTLEYLFPGHSLSDEILFKKYEIYYKKRDYKKASDFLQQVYDYNPEDILADNALFLLAELNELQFNNTEKAMELYKQILTAHSDSIFVHEARKRFRKLRGDTIN